MTVARDKWYALPAEEVVKVFGFAGGLSQGQADERLKKEGKNKLPEPKRRGYLVRFLSQFHNVLIYLLLTAVLITFIIREYIDSTVILGVVIVNALIGFIQEGKAEKALDSLRKLLSPNAVVIRDGIKKTIPAEELVKGDIVILNAGDKIPADLRLISTHNLRTQEAILTGESDEQEKFAQEVSEKTALSDRTSMVYSGTSVTYGSGKGIVVATGINTEVGKISTMLTHITKIMTPLLRKMQIFARWLTIIILLVGVFAFLYGYLFHTYAINQLFMASVSLVVAAIPEGLPAIMTITLAVGVTRMARKNSIIRHLPSVETMGSVTVICTDKTGTLTRNELSIQHILTPEQQYFVSGEGYHGKGEIFINEKVVDVGKCDDLNSCILASILCNDAELRKDDEWHIEGTPLDAALLALGLKAKLNYKHLRNVYSRIDVIPFDSANKYMAVLVKKPDDTMELIVKGAPEIILSFCDSRTKKNYWEKKLEELTSQGLRVIAVAKKTWPSSKTDINADDIKEGFDFLGLYGLIDPPRKESADAVRKCLDAGISVKMITGDHALTAKNIATQVGIQGEVLTGSELDNLSDEEFMEKIADVSIFARTTPEHKLRIVKALQKNGQIVAMTGDGVNDAPALKRADIGIAMGIKGTDVSKETSDMVLADDNFASIQRAVVEGRTVYENLKKAILYILPNSGGEAMAIVVAVMLGMILPITPLQILWINMVTTVTLDMAMAFEPVEKDVMKRPPRNPSAPLFEAKLVWRVAYVAFLVVIAAFGFFIWEQFQGRSVDESRTVVVNALVVLEIMYLINCRHITASVLSKEGVFGSRAVLISISVVILLQLIFTYLPIMQYFFSSTPIGVLQWLAIGSAAMIFFLLVELEKWILWRPQGDSNPCCCRERAES